ncbi:universal stress protein [Dyella nitratireducens]|uniref:universal stress protein n=1 Tax=Dyella nitratireducens TaxID=1849580 RepID=UPI0016628F40|nr:universal stress protein [Dyella nitratireducens]GLQ42146.1 universal stress protein A [Dyella nitratireducens]
MLTEESKHAVTPKTYEAQPPSLHYRDVLALATSTGPWSPALLAAIELAALWRSNVTGCYVPGHLREQRAHESEATVMSLLTDIDYDCVEDAHAFQVFACSHGARYASWMVTRMAVAPTLRKLGAWHDVAVLERDMVDETRVFDVLGEAMLGCRIPCLILPPHWDKALSFKRIVIGWNGSFEATRALHGALPLLKNAEEVTLINGEIRTPYDSQVSVAEPDPIIYLMHHGVAAKPHYIRVPADEAGEVLLKKAKTEHSDLLVMGGYGHSRIRERVLGGATRHVMAHADIPVFMQH